MKIRVGENDPAITWQFARSSGPGGQNVNKSETKVILYFDFIKSPSLTSEEKTKLCCSDEKECDIIAMKVLQNKMTAGGKIVITNQESRGRDDNKKNALENLNQLLDEALQVQLIRKEVLPKKAKSKDRSNKEVSRFIKYKRSKEGKIGLPKSD